MRFSSDSATFRSVLLLASIVWLCGLAKAQTPAWQWGVQSAGTAPDQVRVSGPGISADRAGHIYIAGTIATDPIIAQAATRSFGTASLTTNANSSSGYVAQVSSMGQWQWVRQFQPVGISPASPGYVYVSDVVATATGETYVAGYASAVGIQVGSFNQPLSNYMREYTFVAYLDATGTCQWLKTLDASFNGGNGPRLARDPVYSILTLASITYSAFQVGSTNLPGSGSEAYLYMAQMSAAGQWLGAAQTTGARINEIDQLTVGPQGQAAVSGLWKGGNLHFGPHALTTPAGGNKSQCFVAQLSASLQAWQWSLGDSAYAGTYFGGLAYSPSGDLWVSGYGPTGTAIGPIVLAAPSLRYVGFAGRLTASGQWTVAYQVSPQGSGSTFFGPLALDAAGNLVVTGLVASTSAGSTTAPLGAFTVSAATNELVIYTARLSAAGQWQYALPVPSATGTAAGVGLQAATLDQSGNYYLSGTLRGSLQVGATSLNSTATFPGTDALLVQAVNAGALATRTAITAPSLACFPSPAHIQAVLPLPGTSEATAVTLLDALGRPARTYSLPAHVTTAALDLAGLAAGLYIVRCGATSGKLVVE